MSVVHGAWNDQGSKPAALKPFSTITLFEDNNVFITTDKPASTK